MGFIEKFEVPDAALSVIERIVTPPEQRIIERLPAVFRPEDVRAALERETGEKISLEQAEEFTKNSYRRGVFSLADESAALYKTGSFYGRLDIFCITEADTYQSFPEETRRALDGWYFDAYLRGLGGDLSEAPTDDEVLTLEETLRAIDADSRQLYLTYCDCRALSGDCGAPKLTCLSYRDGINSFAHRGVSRPVSKEEGARVVLEADRAGLAHTRNGGGFCNCCDDCCYLFRARRARNSGALWPKVTKTVSVDYGLCLACGACAERCRFGALALADGNLTADGAKCVGCGLCVNACPVGALTLLKLD